MNAIILVQFMKGRNAGHPPHPPRLSVVLKMKGKEAKWVDAEFKKHIAEKSELLDAQKALRAQIKLDKNATVQNQGIYQKIGELQTKIDACTFEHFTRVKAHCNAQQAKKLAEVVHRMIEQSDRPGPRP
jgi:predicted ATPase